MPLRKFPIELYFAHLWGHPEYRPGGLLSLLAARRPAGLHGCQAKVTNLHGEVVVVQENVIGLEVPGEDYTFQLVKNG